VHSEDPQTESLPADEQGIIGKPSLNPPTEQSAGTPAPNPPAVEEPKTAKAPPEVTGIDEITYPCGCTAKGNGSFNLPALCPEHPEKCKEAAPIVNAHGQVFDAEVYATMPDGNPATDSQGKFIKKELHYAGPPRNRMFGS
jgi:hypothetical protein